MHPVEKAALNTAEALSFTIGFSFKLFFSKTASMISESKGTKISATEIPRRQIPPITTPILLGKPRSSDGPNKNSANVEAKRAI